MALRIISSAQITLNNVFDSFNVIVSNENFSIACDDIGIPLPGEIGQNGKAISTISVYRANTKLTPVSSNPSANQFSISIANQINCQGAKKDNDKIYINTLSNGVTGKIVVNINIEGNNTVTKEITFSKTLNSLSDLIDGKFVFGLSNWTNTQNGTGDIGSNVKIIDSNLSTYTGKLLEVTNEKWFYNKKTIDVEDNKIYEFKIRFKQSIDNTTGGKHSYFGYTPYNSAGNAFGTNGSNNMYLINGEQLSTTSWKEATFYLSKTALPELINDGKVIRPAVRAFPTGTVKFRPMFIVNYQGGNGVALVDYCLVQDVSDKFNIKELDYKTTVLESKNGEINAAVNKIRTFAQLSNNPISLAAKVNYAAYDSPNDGEVYVHGLNSQKKAADIDGSCLWQDNQITLPKQMFNPNGLVPEQTAIFMVRSTADNKWYSVWKDGTTWKRVAADVTTNNTISTFTPSDTTDIFIGYYVTRKSNNQNAETPIDVAQIFTGALDYRQASSMSFASSISQMKIIEDEVSLKSSKDEMLMGVNKWKRTKYRKTLANSSTYPTFNDIANLTPIAQDEVRDSTNLVAGMTGDDHFILHFFTNVFVKSAKNISITGNNVDDTATFFVNGVEAGRINTSETVTMSLKAGWNTLEILFYEHEGGESMNINTNISSLVDNMAYAIGGQSSAITLTPNQIDIMSKNINLTGKVTIDSLGSGMRDMFSTENGKTVIDGGHIKTGSINADNISTGTLNTDRLNIGGVINKINADGSHTISGNKVTIDGKGISSVFSTKTELNNKIDNIQIGGRNLLNETAFHTISHWGVQGNHSINIDSANKYLNNNSLKITTTKAGTSGNLVLSEVIGGIQNNKSYTVSFYAKSASSTNVNLHCELWGGRNSFDITLTQDWTYVKRELIGSTTNQHFYLWLKTVGSCFISKLKLEEGNKATDWTPAPEDADEAIKQAQRAANDANQMFTNMASDSKLTPAEKKNTKTEWQNINNEYSRIRQQAINVGVTTTAYDNSYNTLNTYLTNLLSNMNTTSDIDNNYKNNFTNYYNARQDLLKAISDKLNGKIDNIKIGGRNLLLHTDFSDLTPNSNIIKDWNVWGNIKVYGNQGANLYNLPHTGYFFSDNHSGFWQKLDPQRLKKNTEYVLSIKHGMQQNVKGFSCYMEYWNNDVRVETTALFSMSGQTNTEKRIYPFKTINKDYTEARFCFDYKGWINEYNCLVILGETKIEEGTKATDWTPAPEDATTKISSIETDFNQTKKEITGRVTKTETDINNLSKGSSQNLLYNSDFLIMNGNLPDGWSIDGNISFDKGTTTLDGVGTFWYDVTGLTSDAWRAVYSSFVKARKGEIFTASAYVLGYQNWSALDNGGAIEIEFWNDSSRLSTCASYFDKTKTDWQRVVVTGTCPNETTRVRLRVHPIRNGRFNMSKPMLQVGSIATGWQRGFNAQDITTRLTSAESKITDTAITNTIKNSNTFYTKDDIDKKGYQTATQVQTTANGVLNKFTSSGGYNLIRNSTAACANTSAWTTNATLGYGINDSMGTDSRYYMYLDNGTTTSERYAFSSRFKLKPNTKYTFNGYFHNYTKCPDFDVFVLSSTVNENVNDTSYTVVNHLIANGNTNGQWKYFTATFTTASNIQSGYVRIDNNGYNANGTGDNRVHWNCIQLIEGEVARPWSPHPSEVYDGVTMIDKNGVTVTASNSNTRTNMSADGFKITDINKSKDIFRVDSNGLYLEGKIKVVEFTEKLDANKLNSDLNNKINNASTNATNAVNKLNNLYVDGRNIAMNTAMPLSVYGTGGENGNTGTPANSNMGGDPYNLSVTPLSTWFKINDTIAISYDWEAIGSNLSGNFKVGFNAEPWECSTQVNLSSSNKKGRVEWTKKIVDSNDSILRSTATKVRVRTNYVPVGTTIKITNLKIEKGNVTKWAPAPEDTYTKEQLKSEINTSNSEINIALQKTYTTTQVVDGKLNSMKVGSRNLIKNSNFYKGTLDGWGFNNPNNSGTVEIIDDDRFTQCAKVSCRENFQGLYQAPERISGKRYSWSAWVKADSNCQLFVSHEQGDGSFNANVGTSWQRIEGSGVWRGNGGALCFYATGAMTYYLANVKYVEGDKVPIDWTPAPEDVDQSISDVYDNTSQLINEVTSNYESAINIMKDSIESTVSETYTTKDDFSTTVESISSKIDQQSDSITASITTATKQLSEDLQDYKDEVTSYMRFDEQGLELGKSNNKFKTRLSNEKLSFIEENQEVAYISNNKMNITDAEIKHQMILGNFAFVPRSNGNMSLKWIRK